MKKRLFYEKFGEMKFVSHLDNIRFLERLFRRAGIGIKYTEGFHPRPKFSFGFPISIGMESYNEPLDFEVVDDGFDNEMLKTLLNSVSTKGFRVISVVDLEERAAISKDYNAVMYEVIFDDEEIQNKFIETINQEEIIVRKEKKVKGRIQIKERDLKKNIVSYISEDNVVFLYLREISPKAILDTIDKEYKYLIKRVGYTNI